MKRTVLGAFVTGALMLVPAIVQAAQGYATADVNMRSGPSTRYPAVTVIPAGESVEIHGCLAEVPWCDVEFYGGRGWVAGRYVQAVYRQRRVYVEPDYYRPLGIPTVVFSVDNYWDRYYRNRDFYRDRDRWRRGSYYGRDYGDRDRDFYRRDDNWGRDYGRRDDEWRFDNRRDDDWRRAERRRDDNDRRRDNDNNDRQRVESPRTEEVREHSRDSERRVQNPHLERMIREGSSPRSPRCTPDNAPC
ncbi:MULTISPECIES: SH3 domain-containing protein [unclassified Sinorhizobium]|uniref:SH3 domain-containing protein n=1 Tax=unclassified Sinorhizobium TaxID=2613772 RepID=UPI0035266942